MPSFLWWDVDDAGRDWRNRYPDDASGAEQWRNAGPEPTVEVLEALLADLQARRLQQPLAARTRTVFISHRRGAVDERYACRVAQIADAEGLDVWLDLLVPFPAIGLGQLPAVAALAIACTIEMGLLNSTCLAAILTSNTDGSRWVPYEYGRVREDRLLAENVCAWLAPEMRTRSLAEYLYLAARHTAEVDLRSWLQRQPGLHRHRALSLRRCAQPIQPLP
jgi:hypothetical protein